MGLKNMFSTFTTDWSQRNEEFFGITPQDWANLSIKESNEFLAEDVEKYWNNPVCEIAQRIIDGRICHHNNKLIPGTFTLTRNHNNDCIDVRAKFNLGKKEEDRIIMVLPCPDIELSWIMGNIKWTPRITAQRDYELIRRDGDCVKQGNLWSYNTVTGEMSKSKDETNPFETLSSRSIAFLKAMNDVDEVTEENWLGLLANIPEFDRSSIYNYSFSHTDMFFNLLRNEKSFASPFKGYTLDVPRIFMRQNTIDSVSNKLIASKSTIFALENYRTIVYKSTSYNSSFSFTDSINYFDAFKTTTSEDAGRHRLLLDNVRVHDGMLWVTEKGTEKNMFEVLASNKTPKVGISMISSSMFGCNNQPKRIMMTAKLSAQSVKTKAQSDPFTNRTPARVVFGDFEGYSYADSIIVSESFAKKLESETNTNIVISSKDCEIFEDLKDKLENGEMELTKEEMMVLYPTLNPMIIKNYSSSTVTRFEVINDTKIKLFIKSVIPFSYGDKLTNLHGSKGVSGLILPDDKMPRLVNDIGDFKAGPFDVIISGFSVIRRNSMGQIFEAWARASGIELEPGEDFIKNVVKTHRKEIAEFSAKSIVEFNGVQSVKPCGIIDMIRLHHHASTKISLSYIKSNSGKMLKVGEQEKLNLAANGVYNVLKELSIRSMHKWEDSYRLVYDLERNRRLPENPRPALMFNKILDSLGVNIAMVHNGERIKTKDPSKSKKFIDEYVASNTRIDVSEMFDEKK